MTLLLVLAAACLAAANGANDTFKGVATLFGSGTARFRGALAWAAVTTFAGSLAAMILAERLTSTFSGRGLVDDGLVASIGYVSSVAIGAGLTVLLATRLGLPVSTTHGLVGALIGAGWAAGSSIDLSRLGGAFLLPLLASPALAALLTGLSYPSFRWAGRKLGVTEATCICIGREPVEVMLPTAPQAVVLQRMAQVSVTAGDAVTCERRYQGRLMGIEVGPAMDRLHFASAGVVSFARGLNDTPKIAALLLLAPAFGSPGGTALVGLGMAAGGLLGARRVAETLSRRITSMNAGQGLAANLITGLVVIAASPLGLPVSTTHVSCGALFGVGAVTRQARWKTIGLILGAWVATLPLGAALGAITFLFLN